MASPVFGSSPLSPSTLEVAAFACEECDKSFKNKDNLQSHISAVHIICLSRCDKCWKEFKNPAYLRNHINRFHDIEIAVCDVCKKVCKSKANLYNHKKDVHERVANLLCNLCGEEQKNYSYLSRHKRRFCKYKVQKVQSVNPTPNSSTEITDEKESSIAPNEKNWTDISEDACSNSENRTIKGSDDDWVFCDLVTNDGLSLKDESKISLVKSQDNRQEDVDKASNVINSIETFSMEVEIKEELNYVELEEKINPLVNSNPVFSTVMSQDNRQEECVNSIETFMKAELKEEVNDVELDEKITPPVFRCTECMKVFQKSRYLKGHMKDMHTENVEEAICDICSKQFRSLTHLKKHIQNVHTSELSACDECGKVYTNKKRLRDHRRSVHEGLELLCHLCSKVFKSKSYLSNHVRRFHNSVDEEKACDHCSKVFKSQNQLYLHFKAVHTIENLPCAICGKIYRNSYLLKKHIQHNHSNEMH